MMPILAKDSRSGTLALKMFDAYFVLTYAMALLVYHLAALF